MRYFLAVLFLWIGMGISLPSTSVINVPVSGLVPCQNSVKTGFDVAEQQYKLMLSALAKDSLFPKTVDSDGKRILEKPEGWTSGFFPGSLWILYAYTKDSYWKREAEKWTGFLKPMQFYTGDHDIGFRMFCSFGNGQKLMPNSEYKSVLITSARSLASRFDPKVGLIKSWDGNTSWTGKRWEYPVIMDNMMNLELLLYAARETGDSQFRHIATTHADRTIRDFYRPDYSSYHVVNYDINTGVHTDQATFQGFSDNSAWARGQAWGLYGFVVMYRETKLPRYLDQAKRIATFLMNHPRLPKDKIPVWDYNAEQPGYQPGWTYQPGTDLYQVRDASAAAITASALYDLSTCTHSRQAAQYKEFADGILETLGTSEYLANSGENLNFILKHSVGSMPHQADVDKPLVYADYYFLEALWRKHRIETKQSIALSKL